ncbi:hypothetical protein [Listeria fleischmannii]|uniref:Uncharacterized protein n=1 Tax=Listeria fleischmannii FSL S10-1203 TaxID=1265822 RepID=W7DGD2_9LIST|nr:hypothetical protein [Listeria fleischmannii]EUJ48692.1 hypothetical protein MCOL2_17142 [Listeria fleischmannii FSL S10-1203]
MGIKSIEFSKKAELLDFIECHTRKYNQDKDDVIKLVTFERIVEELQSNIQMLEKGESYHFILEENSSFYPSLAFFLVEKRGDMLLLDHEESGY